MRAVIFVNGRPRAGKDTFIEMMSRHATRNGLAVGSFSSIEPVKKMLLLGPGICTGKKTEKDRKLLAAIGDALQEHNNWRTQWCLKKTEDFFKKNRSGLFFLHVREPEIIDQISRTLGFLCETWTIRVDSDCAENITSNSADAGTNNMRYDLGVSNNGTLEDLSMEAWEALRCIVGRVLSCGPVQHTVERKLNLGNHHERSGFR